MINRQTITDFGNKIIGYIDVDTNTGDKTVIAFGGKILGYYKAVDDTTVAFGGRIIGHGDMCASFLFQNK